jgi:hypothetical protein
MKYLSEKHSGQYLHDILCETLEEYKIEDSIIR